MQQRRRFLFIHFTLLDRIQVAAPMYLSPIRTANNNDIVRRHKHISRASLFLLFFFSPLFFKLNMLEAWQMFVLAFWHIQKWYDTYVHIFFFSSLDSDSPRCRLSLDFLLSSAVSSLNWILFSFSFRKFTFCCRKKGNQKLLDFSIIEGNCAICKTHTHHLWRVAWILPSSFVVVVVEMSAVLRVNRNWRYIIDDILVFVVRETTSLCAHLNDWEIVLRYSVT